MAAGRRVLVSGMGGDLGSRVAAQLEHEDWVGELVGIDVDPPRRRLHRADVPPRSRPIEHDRTVETITAFNPHVVVHISVWEPHSRANPATARQLTDDAATSILGAAAECRALESVIVRSGIEVYGRAHGAPTRPDESADVDPTCDYGEMLAGIERTAAAIGRRVGVSVGAIRMGTVLGPHVPSPLGRVLRMPAVPFSVLADPPFAVVEDVDVARAFVAAARAPARRAGQRRRQRRDHRAAGGPPRAAHPGPARRPGLGASPGPSAGCSGRRSPTTSSRRCTAAGSPTTARMDELLGFTSPTTTMDVIDALYEWPTVVRTPARRAVAVMTDTGYEARVLTLPVERTLTAAPQAGGRARGARQVAAGRHVARRRLGPRPGARRRRRPARRAALEHRGRRRRSPAGARRRADRRQRPALRAGAGPRRARHRPRDRPPGALRRPTRRRPGRRRSARRLGGLLARPDEVAGALRAGELLVMPAPTDGAPAPRRPRRPPPDRRRRRDEGGGLPGGDRQLAVEPLVAHRDRPGRAPRPAPARAR